MIVVEDARDCSEALEVALIAAGSFTVLTCGSAEEALDLMRVTAPAAVVTDIHLPGICGLTLIRELRVRFAESRVKFVAVSGASDPDVRRQALSAGAHAFFAKPYSPLEICRVLEGLLHED